MKRRLLSLTLLILVTLPILSCEPSPPDKVSPSTTKPSSKSYKSQTERYEDYIENLDPKSDTKSKELMVCYDAGTSIKNRKVFEAVIDAWNKNGRVILRQIIPGSGSPCLAWVVLHTVNTTDYAGETEFYWDKVIRVSISTRYYSLRTTLCHELGHVLGLPHKPGTRSCLNHRADFGSPTREDLQQIRRHGWEFERAAETAFN